MLPFDIQVAGNYERRQGLPQPARSSSRGARQYGPSCLTSSRSAASDCQDTILVDFPRSEANEFGRGHTWRRDSISSTSQLELVTGRNLRAGFELYAAVGRDLPRICNGSDVHVLMRSSSSVQRPRTRYVEAIRGDKNDQESNRRNVGCVLVTAASVHAQGGDPKYQPKRINKMIELLESGQTV